MVKISRVYKVLYQILTYHVLKNVQHGVKAAVFELVVKYPGYGLIDHSLIDINMLLCLFQGSYNECR